MTSEASPQDTAFSLTYIRYDAAGNMVYGPSALQSQQTTPVHYVYDAWNRLVAVYADNGSGGLGAQIAGYQYDGLSRRVKKSLFDPFGNPTGGDQYYYSQNGQVLEDRSVDTNGVAQSIDQYICGPGSAAAPLVCLHDGNADGDPTNDDYYTDWRRYYLTDANGDVTTMIRFGADPVFGSDGIADVTRVVYTAYGTATEMDENWTGTGVESGCDGPLYCGYWHDTDTGLSQTRNRYYNPNLSTWINRDPVGYDGGNNLYGYVGDDPTNATDPTGLANLWNPVMWGLNNPSQGWSGFLNPFSAENRAATGTFASTLVVDEIYGGGKALVTGEAGAALGNRAVGIVQTQTGTAFTGTASDWARFGRGVTGDLVGVNFVVEAGYGYDISNRQQLDAWERSRRGAAGISAIAGTAAGGLSTAARYPTLFPTAAGAARVSAIRANVLSNIGESQAARASSGFLQFDRQVVARQFYAEAGFSGGRLEAHLQGIDFSQPVTIETIAQGAYVEQWVKGGTVGNYFSPVGQAPEAGGIARYMRTPVAFQASQGVTVLRSYAAPITDTWTLGPKYPIQTPGGGVQYFAPSRNLFDPVFGP